MLTRILKRLFITLTLCFFTSQPRAYSGSDPFTSHSPKPKDLGTSLVIIEFLYVGSRVIFSELITFVSFLAQFVSILDWDFFYRSSMTRKRNLNIQCFNFLFLSFSRCRLRHLFPPISSTGEVGCNGTAVDVDSLRLCLINTSAQSLL